MVEEQSGGAPDDGPWLTVAAAARRLGVSPRAIRGRIRRGTIEWKAAGNAGKLVLVPEGDVSPDAAEDGPEDAFDLLAEMGELRAQLARAEARLEAAEAMAQARVVAARESAEAHVLTARAEAKAVRELADRLTAELAEVRRPWWRRLLR